MGTGYTQELIPELGSANSSSVTTERVSARATIRNPRVFAVAVGELRQAALP